VNEPVEDNVKIQPIKILAILFSLTLACTTISIFPKLTPQPTSTPEVLHFEHDLVAFDYPAGTRIFTGADQGFNTYPSDIRLMGEFTVGLADPGWISDLGTLFSSIGVFRHTLPPGSSLEQGGSV